MPQVKLLSVDLIQSVENVKESNISESSLKNSEAFSDLVDKQMSRDASGNEKGMTPHPSGKIDAEHNKFKDKAVPNDSEKNQFAEKDLDAGAQEQLEQANALPSDENNKADTKGEQPALLNDEGSEHQQSDTHESQALLNLLSASNGMLKSSLNEPVKNDSLMQALQGEETSLEPEEILALKEEHKQLASVNGKGHVGAHHLVNKQSDELATPLQKQSALNMTDGDIDLKLETDNSIKTTTVSAEEKVDSAIKTTTVSAEGKLGNIAHTTSSKLTLDTKVASPELLTLLQQQTEEVLTDAELVALAEKAIRDPKVKELLLHQPNSEATNKVLAKLSAENNTNKTDHANTTTAQSSINEAELSNDIDLGNEVEHKLNNGTVTQTSVFKNAELESNKLSSGGLHNLNNKQAADKAETSLTQSSNDAEQEGKQQHADGNVELVQQLKKQQETEELQLKPEKALNKGMVAETLQHTSGLTHSAKLDVENINDSANEQLVEQLTNRVIKENQQVQKTQTAIDTIAIYKKEFANEIKEKVMVMISQKLQQVDIKLDPPELGNIHVRVNLQNEQASVNFIVQNQQAKDALEQHMNKLRDMLSESGVDVGDSNIEHRNSSSGDNQSNDAQGHFSDGESEDENAQVTTLSANMVKASAVGVDFYA